MPARRDEFGHVSNHEALDENSTARTLATGEAEELSATIAAIYDCVFDPAAWPTALAKITGLIGGCAASLISHRLPDQLPERAAEFGTDPIFSESYATRYALINPLFAMTILEMAEGEIRTLHRSVDLRAFHRTRFFREWVRPQGWGDWLGVVITRSSSRLSLLAIARLEAAGSFLADELRWLALLTPHLRRAAMLSRIFDSQSGRGAGITALLDRMSNAALLIGLGGEIVFANAAARAMLAEGDLLASNTGGLLKIADPLARTRLRDAIAGRARPDDLVVGSAGKRFISILPPSTETGGFVAMLVSRPEVAHPPPGPVLRRIFGLTAAELRVLAALLRGRTLTEIADDFGVAPRTVKTHLQRLFEKTGTSRQSDLVREVMQIAPPFAVE